MYCGLHLLLMYVHLGFHFFLSGLCPGLVDIYPRDESTSKDHRLLVIGALLKYIHSLFKHSLYSYFSQIYEEYDPRNTPFSLMYEEYKIFEC
jgi:hypothetical protein